MSNIGLARVLLVAMQSLAYMVVWYVRGNFDQGNKCKENFDKMLADLDRMSELERELNSNDRRKKHVRAPE